MTGGGSGSGSDIGVVVPPPPPAHEEITNEATAMKNWDENTGRSIRFMVVQFRLADRQTIDPAAQDPAWGGMPVGLRLSP